MVVYIIIYIYFDKDDYDYEKMSSIYRDFNEAQERVIELNSMYFPRDIKWYKIDEMWVH